MLKRMIEFMVANYRGWVAFTFCLLAVLTFFVGIDAALGLGAIMTVIFSIFAGQGWLGTPKEYIDESPKV